MCEYCTEPSGTSRTEFAGGDGIMYNENDGKHYLVIEHFRREINQLEISHCPQCGRKLDSTEAPVNVASVTVKENLEIIKEIMLNQIRALQKRFGLPSLNSPIQTLTSRYVLEDVPSVSTEKVFKCYGCGGMEFHEDGLQVNILNSKVEVSLASNFASSNQLKVLICNGCGHVNLFCKNATLG